MSTGDQYNTGYNALIWSDGSGQSDCAGGGGVGINTPLQQQWGQGMLGQHSHHQYNPFDAVRWNPEPAVYPGTDFRHKTYYSGIMEAVIALCSQHGVSCTLRLPDALEASTEELNLPEFVEVIVYLFRDGEGTELPFDTICALAADGNIEGLSQFIEVNCSLLPRGMPETKKEDDIESKWQLMQQLQQQKAMSAMAQLGQQQQAMLQVQSSPAYFTQGMLSTPPMEDKDSFMEKIKKILGTK